MKQTIYKWLAAIFSVILNLSGADAQETDQRNSLYNQQDSLMHYLQIAAEKNPLVMQRYYQFQAALERVPQAGALPDPEFTAGVFLTPMELVMGNQVAELSLMQMFPWFGVLSNAKDEMSYMAKASYESFRDAKLQVFYDMQRTWFDLYRLQKDIQITEKNIRILEMIERLSLSRYKSGTLGTSSQSSPVQGGSMAQGSTGYNSGSSASTSGGGSQSGMGSMGSASTSGMASGASTGSGMSSGQSMQSGSSMTGSTTGGLSDIYRIQIEVSELQNNLLLLKDRQNTVLAKFNAYLNRPSLSPVTLPDTLTADTVNLDLALVTDSIRERNPMLSMLQYEQQSIDARREMNRRMGLPMVGIGLNYSVITPLEMAESETTGQDMVMPMLKLTLPIYRKKYKAQQNEAEALKNASHQSYQETANNLEAEYFEALQLYNDSKRRMQLYKNQGQLAQRSLDIMIRSFSSAYSQLTDVLTVRQQLLNYELLEVQAIADYNTAIAWLKRLSGQMPVR